jgi:hypothetical protein
MTHTLTLIDEADDLRLNRCEVEVEIAYDIDPGDPGCWRTANGDGWPSTPPTAEIRRIEVKEVTSPDGLPRPVTLGVLDEVHTWASNKIEAKWEEIEADLLQQEDN